jgi:glycogen synthase
MEANSGEAVGLTSRRGTSRAVAEKRGDQRTALRVLHVVDHSRPVLSGYSVRTHSLLLTQRSLGHQAVALTGPLHQLDDPGGEAIVADGIAYLRTPLAGGFARGAVEGGWPLLREMAVVRLLRRRMSELLATSAIDVVHAHSPALCGLAARQAARAACVPFVYEIRAFWEDAAVNLEKTRPGGIRYQLSRSLESYVVRGADAVVGIAGHILDDLRARGIPEGKLFHVPNGVDAERFPPRPRDPQLAAALGLDGAPLLAFVGSLYRYEGIAWLVNALAELRRRALPAKLLVVGEGEDLETIRQAVRQTASERHVILAGRVPHEQVQRYYSLADILVYPRLSVRLTELTTPLKPLEAMAQAKAVLASDVGGIRELIDSERTGMLFRAGDMEDFCRQAERLIRNGGLRRELGERARQEVLRQKDWKVVAQRYQTVYATALRRHRTAR